LFYVKVKEQHQLGIDFSVHHRTVPAVKRLEFVSNRMPHILLRGRWFNITVSNMYAQCKEKSDDSKDSFYEELQQVFDYFPKYKKKNTHERF